MTKGKSRRGIILSLAVVLMFTLLIKYATDVQNAKISVNSAVSRLFAAEKLGYYLDDIGTDMRTIVSASIPANSTTMVFAENMTINKSSFFSNYSRFISNYSNNTNANIFFNTTNPFQVILSDGLVYQTNYTNRQIKVFNSTGSTASVTGYRIDVVSNTTRQFGGVSYPTYIGSGTRMVVNYTDPVSSRSFFTQGYVNPAAGNVLSISYSGGRDVYVVVGLIDGRDNSFMLNQSGIDAFPYVTITVNRSTKDTVSAFYNASLNVSMPGTNFSGMPPAN